ncbi:protein of unknown function (plasmid) [Cupriavidus taiwanensis]|nr:protein of unknown function [Cupriavidus taiwanensis]SPA03401.1 protein of unknown function [Cupriavidus taiwanensis]
MPAIPISFVSFTWDIDLWYERARLKPGSGAIFVNAGSQEKTQKQYICQWHGRFGKAQWN